MTDAGRLPSTYFVTEEWEWASVGCSEECMYFIPRVLKFVLALGAVWFPSAGPVT